MVLTPLHPVKQTRNGANLGEPRYVLDATVVVRVTVPVGGVHRAKRQLEKDAARGRQNATAIAQQLPTSYVVKQDVGGVPQDVR